MESSRLPRVDWATTGASLLRLPEWAVAPCSSSSFSLQTRDIPEMPWACPVTRGGGVEWREYVLSLPGRWMVHGKQGKREGDKVPLLMPIGEGTRVWQLFKPAALGPEQGPAG